MWEDLPTPNTTESSVGEEWHETGWIRSLKRSYCSLLPLMFLLSLKDRGQIAVNLISLIQKMTSSSFVLFHIIDDECTYECSFEANISWACFCAYLYDCECLHIFLCMWLIATWLKDSECVCGGSDLLTLSIFSI